MVLNGFEDYVKDSPGNLQSIFRTTQTKKGSLRASVSFLKMPFICFVPYRQYLRAELTLGGLLVQDQQKCVAVGFHVRKHAAGQHHIPSSKRNELLAEDVLAGREV